MGLAGLGGAADQKVDIATMTEFLSDEDHKKCLDDTLAFSTITSLSKTRLASPRCRP